jgi:hypothetical protein
MYTLIRWCSSHQADQLSCLFCADPGHAQGLLLCTSAVAGTLRLSTVHGVSLDWKRDKNQGLRGKLQHLAADQVCAQSATGCCCCSTTAVTCLGHRAIDADVATIAFG